MWPSGPIPRFRDTQNRPVGRTLQRRFSVLDRFPNSACAENRDAGGMRSMDHSTSIIVIDAQGLVVVALPPPHQCSEVLRQFNALRTYLGD